MSTSLAELVDAFTNASDLGPMLAAFNAVREACNLPEPRFFANGFLFYQAMSEVWRKAFPRGTRRLRVLDRLDKHITDYELQARGKAQLDDAILRVMIVGAGPAGLRAAIDLALMNSRVAVIEKYTSFSRNNVLHVWPQAKQDFRALGVDCMVQGSFCAGTINHIPIRKLQLGLAKVAVLCGVSLWAPARFARVLNPGPGHPLWRVETNPPLPHVTEFEFNVLLGADGLTGPMATCLGYKKKLTRKRRMLIGITCNYNNSMSASHMGTDEINYDRTYFRAFFRGLADQGPDLENLVYYRDSTHYIVATAIKKNLLSQGVLRKDLDGPEQLLAPENVDQDRLRQFVDTIASYIKLPSSSQLLKQRNRADIGIFYFGTLERSLDPVRTFEQRDGDGVRLLWTFLIGDALMAPFWPLGTGANHASLSAIDAVYTLSKVLESGALGCPLTQYIGLKRTLSRLITYPTYLYRRLRESTPNNLAKSGWKPDPRFRYGPGAPSKLINVLCIVPGGVGSAEDADRQADDGGDDDDGPGTPQLGPVTGPSPTTAAKPELQPVAPPSSKQPSKEATKQPPSPVLAPAPQQPTEEEAPSDPVVGMASHPTEEPPSETSVQVVTAQPAASEKTLRPVVHEWVTLSPVVNKPKRLSAMVSKAVELSPVVPKTTVLTPEPRRPRTASTSGEQQPSITVLTPEEIPSIAAETLPPQEDGSSHVSPTSVPPTEASSNVPAAALARARSKSGSKKAVPILDMAITTRPSQRGGGTKVASAAPAAVAEPPPAGTRGGRGSSRKRAPKLDMRSTARPGATTEKSGVPSSGAVGMSHSVLRPPSTPDPARQCPLHAWDPVVNVATDDGTEEEEDEEEDGGDDEVSDMNSSAAVRRAALRRRIEAELAAQAVARRPNRLAEQVAAAQRQAMTGSMDHTAPRIGLAYAEPPKPATPVDTLVQMGFRAADAVAALEISASVNEAVTHLLQQQREFYRIAEAKLVERGIRPTVARSVVEQCEGDEEAALQVLEDDMIAKLKHLTPDMEHDDASLRALLQRHRYNVRAARKELLSPWIGGLAALSAMGHTNVDAALRALRTTQTVDLACDRLFAALFPNAHQPDAMDGSLEHHGDARAGEEQDED